MTHLILLLPLAYYAHGSIFLFLAITLFAGASKFFPTSRPSKRRFYSRKK